MNTTAAATIDSVVNERNTYKKRNKKLKDKFEQKRSEFQQYKRRKNEEQEEIKQTATKDFVQDALPIHDNLTRALDQDNDNIRDGVKLTHDKFTELLKKEGITVINPAPGEEVDPEVHEVLSRVESDDISDGKIVDCYKPGYVMENTVIRTARVTVSSTR